MDENKKQDAVHTPEKLLIVNALLITIKIHILRQNQTKHAIITNRIISNCRIKSKKM